MELNTSATNGNVKQRYAPAEDKFKDNYNRVMWCTPSVLEEVIIKHKQFCDYEGSVSIKSLGELQYNTGVFKEMHELAAEAYGNKYGHSHYVCEGTTGANRIVFNLIAEAILKKGEHVLCTRNVHQSIVDAAMKNNVPIKYIKPKFDEDLCLFLPPDAESVVKEIERKKTRIVVLSNPTYEGLSCDMEHIVKKIREKDDSILIYIDEAWGAHLPFNDRLPMSGISAGADFIVQSMHKQGGAPNPASIIHLNRRIKEEYLRDFFNSYQHNTSTTYSYPLIAAMDAARKIMFREGKNRIDYMIKCTDAFKKGARAISGLSVVEPERLAHPIYSYDLTKVILDARNSGLEGNLIAKILEEEHDIVVERYDQNSLCLLTTFKITDREVEYTLNALKEIVEKTPRNPQNRIRNMKLPEKPKKVYETFEANKMEKKDVLLEQSIGRTAGESIQCYPPGIYVVQVGEIISEPVMLYLKTLRGNGNIHAYDDSLKCIKVIDG